MPRDFFSPQSRKPVASERQESQFSSLSGSSLTFGGEAWGRGGKKACARTIREVTKFPGVVEPIFKPGSLSLQRELKTGLSEQQLCYE